MKAKNKISSISLIVFDLDGTLYNFAEGSFQNSGLKKIILQNAAKYISKKLNKNKKEAKLILAEIIKEYGEDISIALERKFKLDRYDYFNTVWDIPAKKFIKTDPETRDLLLKLKKRYQLALVSDAPLIWIKRVLTELRIYDIFKNQVFSGEADIRKGFGNYFQKIIKFYQVKPAQCLVIGDQENTDIIPAKKLGMATVYINEKKGSCAADYCINNLQQIVKILK